jgi:4-amino-4-deoxy-L-arabinose transferase-like glycosyltransferase
VLLAGVLVACLAPMLVGLGARDSTHTMENVAVVVSQETWLRWHDGEPLAWLVTFNDSRPRVEKPPFLTWLHFIGWADLDPDTAEPVRLIHRARLVAVLLGLLMLASIFWLGVTLADVRLGVIAALVAGSTVFFERQARTASYDIHFAAWATLAVAGALWAMKPRGEPPSAGRAWLGWIVCALATSASVMTKNPLALALVVVPIAGAAAVLPGRRRNAGLGLLLTGVVTLATAGSWYLYVSVVHEDALRTLRGEFSRPVTDVQPFYYYAGLLLLVFPWTPWLVAGLVHPFAAGAAGHRRARLVAWMWFVLVFLLFSAFGTKQQRYILPVVPAVGLLIGAVWLDHDRASEEGAPVHPSRTLLTTHWVILLVTSFVGPFLAIQESVVAGLSEWQDAILRNLREAGREDGVLWRWVSATEWPSAPLMGAIPAWAGVVVTAVLLCLAVAAMIVHRRGHPFRSGVLSAVWTLVLLGVVWESYGRAPSARHPLRAHAEEFALRAGTAPVHQVRPPDSAGARHWLNEEFRIYYGRRVRPVADEDVAALLRDTPGRVVLLAYDRPKVERMMLDAGLADRGLVQVDRTERLRVWVRE